MATYVIIHGATAGGWYMRQVASRLRAAGHEVYTPTLTGLGERAHLLSPDIGLKTHIQDILGVLAYEDLNDVILVGKSYSGMVITGVAEKAADRIAHLVYLDAVVPQDGQSMKDLFAPEIAAGLEAIIREHGEDWRLPADKSLDPRLTDHPFKTVTEPLEVKNRPAGRSSGCIIKAGTKKVLRAALSYPANTSTRSSLLSSMTVLPV